MAPMSELAFAEPWPELELAYGLNSADHLVVQSGEIKAWTPDGSGCAWWSRDRRGGWRSREPAGASLRPCLERFCQIDGRFRGSLRLILQLDVEFADGTTKRFVSDRSWR